MASTPPTTSREDRIAAWDDRHSLMFAKLVDHVQKERAKQAGGLVWKPETINRRPRPLVSHSRVGGKGCSVMWFERIHSVGFRLSWWDNYPGVTEFYVWNHNGTLHVQDATITTRQPDWEACLKMLELIRLVSPTD